MFIFFLITKPLLKSKFIYPCILSCSVSSQSYTSNSNMSINTAASTGSHSTSSESTLNIIVGSLSSKKRSEISLHESSTGSTRSVNQPFPGNEFTSFDESLEATSSASPQPINPPLVDPTESVGGPSSPKKVVEPKMNIIIDSFADQTKEQYNIEDSLHFDRQGKIAVGLLAEEDRKNAKSVGPSGPPSPGSACSTTARPYTRHSKKQKK